MYVLQWQKSDIYPFDLKALTKKFPLLKKVENLEDILYYWVMKNTYDNNNFWFLFSIPLTKITNNNKETFISLIVTKNGKVIDVVETMDKRENSQEWDDKYGAYYINFFYSVIEWEKCVWYTYHTWEQTWPNYMVKIYILNSLFKKNPQVFKQFKSFELQTYHKFASLSFWNNIYRTNDWTTSSLIIFSEKKNQKPLELKKHYFTEAYAYSTNNIHPEQIDNKEYLFDIKMNNPEFVNTFNYFTNLEWVEYWFNSTWFNFWHHWFRKTDDNFVDIFLNDKKQLIKYDKASHSCINLHTIVSQGIKEWKIEYSVIGELKQNYLALYWFRFDGDIITIIYSQKEEKWFNPLNIKYAHYYLPTKSFLDKEMWDIIHILTDRSSFEDKNIEHDNLLGVSLSNKQILHYLNWRLELSKRDLPYIYALSHFDWITFSLHNNPDNILQETPKYKLFSDRQKNWYLQEINFEYNESYIVNDEYLKMFFSQKDLTYYLTKSLTNYRLWEKNDDLSHMIFESFHFSNKDKNKGIYLFEWIVFLKNEYPKTQIAIGLLQVDLNKGIVQPIYDTFIIKDYTFSLEQKLKEWYFTFLSKNQLWEDTTMYWTKLLLSKNKIISKDNWFNITKANDNEILNCTLLSYSQQWKLISKKIDIDSKIKTYLIDLCYNNTSDKKVSIEDFSFTYGRVFVQEQSGLLVFKIELLWLNNTLKNNISFNNMFDVLYVEMDWSWNIIEVYHWIIQNMDFIMPLYPSKNCHYIPNYYAANNLHERYCNYYEMSNKEVSLDNNEIYLRENKSKKLIDNTNKNVNELQSYIKNFGKLFWKVYNDMFFGDLVSNKSLLENDWIILINPFNFKTTLVLYFEELYDTKTMQEWNFWNIDVLPSVCIKDTISHSRNSDLYMLDATFLKNTLNDVISLNKDKRVRYNFLNKRWKITLY